MARSVYLLTSKQVCSTTEVLSFRFISPNKMMLVDRLFGFASYVNTLELYHLVSQILSCTEAKYLNITYRKVKRNHFAAV